MADLSLEGSRHSIGCAFAARHAAHVGRIAADFLCYAVIDATIKSGQAVQGRMPILTIA
jgi:hypothetical protein